MNNMKTENIEALLLQYAENELDDVPCRFDIIEVYLERDGSRIKRINHLEEAVRP